MIDHDTFRQHIEADDFVAAYNLIKNESAADIPALASVMINHDSHEKPLLFYLAKRPAIDGCFALISSLIRAGVSVDVKYEGMPLLYTAVCWPKIDDEKYNRAIDRNFRIILEAANEVDPLTPTGANPLSMAAHTENGNIAYWLCERGADPSIRDESGMNALAEANPDLNPKGPIAEEIYKLFTAYVANGNKIPENLKRREGVDFI
jgi:hypothetical protein